MEELVTQATGQSSMSFLQVLVQHNGFIQLLAGLVGGLCGTFVQPGDFRTNLGRIIIGGACGFFLYPLAIPLLSFLNLTLNIEELGASDNGMAGFIVGSVGLLIVEGFMVTAKAYIKKVSQLIGIEYEDSTKRKNNGNSSK